jgi:hypothetical protein
MTIAQDRAASVRSYDTDGRLHISIANISKANVCPYMGREIPDEDRKLGLDPDRIYYLFRDPAELEKAAPTFNNLPLLSEHVPIDAATHPHDLVIGATGSEAEFRYPYLTNSLVVWPEAAISQVLDGSKKEISCAYRYTAIPEPGIFEGQRYDLRMTAIIGNHVSLVESGRAGSDVVVGDEAVRREGPLAK